MPFSLLTFLISLSILSIRGWDRIVHAHLWAEDGAIFLSQAYSLGLRSFFTPYGGYFHALPRLMAYFGKAIFPISAIPTFFALICVFAYAAIVAFITSDRSNLFQLSKTARIALAVGLCVVPGLSEALGNLANLHIFFLIALGFIALKTRPLEISDLLLVLGVVTSEGSAIIFIPLFLYRLWLAKKNHHLLSREMVKEFGPIVIILAFAVLNFAVREHLAHTQFDLKRIALPLVSSIFGLESLYPVFGHKLFENLPRYGAFGFLFIGGPVLAAGIVLARKQLSKVQFRALLLFMQASLFQAVLTWIVRPGTETFFYSGGMAFWVHRYTYFRTATGIVFWAVVIGKICENFKSPILKVAPSLAYICLLLGNSLFFWEIRAYGDKYNWSQSAAAVTNSQATGCPESVNIPIYPDWNFTIHSQFQCKKLETKQ